MLSQEQVITSIKGGRKAQAFDGRDFTRLAGFFPKPDLEIFGCSLKDGAAWEATAWTEEEVRSQLKHDVGFAFEKAYGKRGISASCMHAVVAMWMWVLEDESLRDGEDFEDYGIDYLRRVAEAHGLTDPGE